MNDSVALVLVLVGAVTVGVVLNVLFGPLSETAYVIGMVLIGLTIAALQVRRHIRR